MDYCHVRIKSDRRHVLAIRFGKLEITGLCINSNSHMENLSTAKGHDRGLCTTNSDVKLSEKFDLIVTLSCHVNCIDVNLSK